MDQFELNKRNALTKLDKSRKQGIDSDIIYLLDEINKKKDYFTTSSCSGRIMVIAKGNRKDLCDWLFVSHLPVKKFSDLKLALQNSLSKNKKDVWFKQEAFILHVSCRDLSAAEHLLSLAKNAGFKRAAIISIKKDKVMFEVIGNGSMETVIAKKGKLAVDDAYLKLILGEANKKLRKTKGDIRKLFDSIKEKLA